MRLWCWYCHKDVSSELPKDTVFRAIAICPECIINNNEIQGVKTNGTNTNRRG